MKLSKMISSGKRITAGILFVGIGAAPQVVPIVAPEYVPLIPVAQGVAATIGAALVGASKWNSWRSKNADSTAKESTQEVGSKDA